MANILTYEVFEGTLDQGIGANNANDRLAKLNKIIIQKVPDYFKMFLGTQEYINYITDCTPSNAYAGVPATSKWTNFLDGTTLTVDDAGTSKKVLYSGFKNVLKFLITTEFVRWTTEIVTNSGNVKKNTKQSEHKSPSDKISENWLLGKKVWGDDWNNDFWELNSKRRNIYYPDSVKFYDTAYNYMYWMNQADADNFPLWEMKELGSLNGMQI